jgi:hypothetical protein
MNIDKAHCPLCGADAEFYVVSSSSILAWVCRRCGEVRLTVQLLSFFEEVKIKLGPRLSVVTRMATENKSPVTLMTTNYEALANALPRYTPMEKFELLLLHLMLKTQEFGADAEFSVEWDYPRVFCRSQSEINFLLVELSKRGYVELVGDATSLTLAGWERASEVKNTGRSSDAVFVAMSFDKSHDTTYEQCIVPAIEGAGYRPLRVDKVEHTNRIDDQIIADIRRSRFMVADLTDQRQGVYFEAGLMLGIGRTVIWMVRKDELSKVHFDNRQYNFIVYEDLDEARDRLRLRILALEGEGPAKNRHGTASHS